MWRVVNLGMRINQIAVQEIKFKATDKIVTQIYWKIIGYHKTTSYLFNNRLSMCIYGSPN